MISPCFIASLAISLVPVSAMAASRVTPIEYRVEIVAPADLASLLEKHLELVKWRGDYRLTVEQLDRLIETTPEQAAGLLATEGYFSPTISVQQDEQQLPRQIRVVVTPGNPVLIRSVDLRLEGPIADDANRNDELAERIDAQWELPTGTVFRQSSWERSKSMALERLSSRDYPTARIISSEARIDPQTESADLVLHIDSGPAYVYGPVQIEGLRRYPEKLVTNMIRIEPGQPYRRRQLLTLQSDIQNLPQFSAVVVEAEYPDVPPYIAPVHVRVDEAPLHRVGVGLGYTTNTGFRTTLDYRYLNLFGQGLAFTSKLNLEQKEQGLDLGVAFPRTEAGYDFTAYLNGKTSSIEGLDTTAYTLGLSRVRQEFRLERSMILEYQTEERSAGGLSDKPTALTFNYVLKHRELDNIRDPRQGHLAQFEIGGGSEQLLSDASFLRLYGKALQYQRLPFDGLLQARIELGQTFSGQTGGIPSDWLFRAGGSNSVRGYDYESLGIYRDGTVYPGKVIGTASLEYQHPVLKDWRAALFADYGGAAASWGELDPVLGLGLGARWVSPVGTLGADLAYGLDREQWRFSLALGLAL
ncbi:autotransporter assembly complex protein TamA [Chitinilyticum piscinae]|uniref:Outer membrane protein assembly factor n=1 Tax=Chitinilyticum piscinae TaxID=2866724 RepID=A0A8J7G105_9NEIS|nr:autotransporter assembly complex family protein [Chitinilyticum piscinae]MBE9609413.1 outer membrane protein assembly factor [Chitinilyticum piscinae]